MDSVNASRIVTYAWGGGGWPCPHPSMVAKASSRRMATVTDLTASGCSCHGESRAHERAQPGLKQRGGGSTTPVRRVDDEEGPVGRRRSPTNAAATTGPADLRAPWPWPSPDPLALPLLFPSRRLTRSLSLFSSFPYLLKTGGGMLQAEAGRRRRARVAAAGRVEEVWRRLAVWRRR